MISFEFKGDSKLAQEQFLVPDKLNYLGNSRLLTMKNIKIYLNGNLLKKKIKTTKYGWRFIKPLKLTKNDMITYIWETE